MQTTSGMKPNSARMWDYVMGGSHNFAIDRATVKLVRKIYPIYEESLIQQRRFLQRAVTYMAKEKELDKFIDFGSGLPTRGNVYEIVQAINPEAKVIYSDTDSITVAVGKEILGGAPNVCYVYCDATEPHTLLGSPVITNMFSSDRRVGIGLVGVAVVVADEPLAHFFDTLYKWVDEGSCIAVTIASRQLKKVKGLVMASKRLGIQFYARSEQEILDLLGPWKLIEPGLVPGVYWGLSEDSPEINEKIGESSYSFVAYK